MLPSYLLLFLIEIVKDLIPTLVSRPMQLKLLESTSSLPAAKFYCAWMVHCLTTCIYEIP